MGAKSRIGYFLGEIRFITNFRKLQSDCLSAVKAQIWLVLSLGRYSIPLVYLCCASSAF